MFFCIVQLYTLRSLCQPFFKKSFVQQMHATLWGTCVKQLAPCKYTCQRSAVSSAAAAARFYGAQAVKKKHSIAVLFDLCLAQA
jgi:hypothetical protein